MRVSHIVVTMGRRAIAEECYHHNLQTCGRKPDELIWVDNASQDGLSDFAKEKADLCLLSRTNMGMAHAFNRAYMLATGDVIVNLGAYCKGPDNWLKVMCEVYEASKADGVCYYHAPVESDPTRFRGDAETHAGYACHRALFLETSLFSKTVLDRFGFYDELLDPYWPMDVEYAFRTDHHGLKALAIYNMMATHCGRGNDIEPMMPNPDGSGGMLPYYAWKQAVQWSPKVLARIDENSKNGYPKFSFNQIQTQITP